jgi:hypothetical protein
MKIGIIAFLFRLLLASLESFANYYLAKPGERAARVTNAKLDGRFLTFLRFERFCWFLFGIKTTTGNFFDIPVFES